MLGVIAVAVGQVGVGGHERQRRVAGHLLVGEVTEPAADASRCGPAGCSGRRWPTADRRRAERLPRPRRGGSRRRRRRGRRASGSRAGGALARARARAGAAARAASAPGDRGSGTTRRCGPGGRPGRWPARGRAAARPSPTRSSTASHSGPERRSSTDVRCRKVTSSAVSSDSRRVGHVVRHDAIVPAEPRDRGGGVRLIAQRHGGEIEPGRPPLGAAHERVDVRSGQLGPGELEQRGRLAPGHDEVARRQLEHLAMRSQAPEGQRRLASRGQHELRARGRILDERRERRRSPLGSAGPGRRPGRGRTRGRGRSADPWRARRKRARCSASSSARCRATHAKGRSSCCAHSSSVVVLP